MNHRSARWYSSAASSRLKRYIVRQTTAEPSLFRRPKIARYLYIASASFTGTVDSCTGNMPCTRFGIAAPEEAKKTPGGTVQHNSRPQIQDFCAGIHQCIHSGLGRIASFQDAREATHTHILSLPQCSPFQRITLVCPIALQRFWGSASSFSTCPVRVMGCAAAAPQRLHSY